jgi:hypothetical protein
MNLFTHDKDVFKNDEIGNFYAVTGYSKDVSIFTFTTGIVHEYTKHHLNLVKDGFRVETSNFCGLQLGLFGCGSYKSQVNAPQKAYACESCKEYCEKGKFITFQDIDSYIKPMLNYPIIEGDDFYGLVTKEKKLFINHKLPQTDHLEIHEPDRLMISFYETFLSCQGHTLPMKRAIIKRVTIQRILELLKMTDTLYKDVLLQIARVYMECEKIELGF